MVELWISVTSFTMSKKSDSSGVKDRRPNQDSTLSTQVQAPASEKPSHLNNATCWWRRINWALVVEVLVLIVGIWVACVYSRQLREMITSNEINRKSVEYVQRPFLNIQPLTPLTLHRNLRDLPSGEKIPSYTISIIWQNSGNTPAVRVFKFATAKDMSEPTDEEFIGIRPLPPEAVPGVIPARADDSPMTIEKSERFMLGDLAQIPPEKRTGINHPVFIWGWAAYHDLFPGTRVHVSEFCLRMVSIEMSTTRVNEPPTFHFNPCANHNYCIDEQCRDYADIAALVER